MAIKGGAIEGPVGQPTIGKNVREHPPGAATPHAMTNHLVPDVHAHLAATMMTPTNKVFGPHTSGSPANEMPNEPTSMKAKPPATGNRVAPQKRMPVGKLRQGY